MTPKEKADELFRDMYYVQSYTGNIMTSGMAKQCAIIAVDNLIDQMYLVKLLIKTGSDESQYTSIDNYRLVYLEEDLTGHEMEYFWEEVKKEIEKI